MKKIKGLTKCEVKTVETSTNLVYKYEPERKGKLVNPGKIAIAFVTLSLATMIATLPIILEKHVGTVENSLRYFFPTAAAVTSNDFSFGAVGDWGCTNDTQDTVSNIVDKDPELVLQLGDTSYDKDGEDCWFQIVEPIDEKMKIAIGNHETKSLSSLNQLINHFDLPDQYYSFNYRNVHFVAVSTESPYQVGSEQYNFVNNDLSRASSDPDINWIVVYYHKLAYTSPADTGKGNSAEKDFRGIYHPLFEKNGVDLALQAHNHNYQRSYPIKYNDHDSENPIVTDTDKNNYHDPEGQIFATVGTGGASLYLFTGQASFVANQYLGYGFLNVDVIDNGTTVVGKFYANNGNIIDQFIITKSDKVSEYSESQANN